MFSKLLFFLIFIEFLSTSNKCLQNPVDQACLFCSYKYFSSFFPQPISENFCLLKNSSIMNLTLIRKVLVSNENVPSNFNLTEFDAIYENLYTAFQEESKILSKFFKCQLFIYLTKGTHYFFTNESMPGFFRRIQVSLYIKPLYCKEMNFIEICNDFDNPFVNIVIKSYFILYVSLKLEIEAIKIDGSDLLLSPNKTDIHCTDQNICCLSDFFENNYDGKSKNLRYLCALNERPIVVNSDSRGMIYLENIYDMDYIGIISPTFILKNTSLINILIINNQISSFILIDAVGYNIVLENVKILNYFAPKGLFNCLKEVINYYKNTDWNENFRNESLSKNLIQKSTCSFSNISFVNTISYNFTQSENEILPFIILDFTDWKSKIYFTSISFSKIINFMKNKVVIFAVSNNLQRIDIQNVNITLHFFSNNFY